jgi:hypothetical protein
MTIALAKDVEDFLQEQGRAIRTPRVLLEFLVARRTRVRVKEIAQFAAAMGTT